MLTMGKESCVLLVGPTFELAGGKLPPNRKALAQFYHHHKNNWSTLHQVATLAVEEALSLWERARIPIKEVCNSITNLENIDDKLALLKSI